MSPVGAGVHSAARMTAKTFIVTIDGPAGSGKSTAARLLASRLGLLYLDTGALYRTATLAGIGSKTGLDDANAMAELLEKIEVQVAWGDQGMTVSLNGRDVSGEIRDPAVTEQVKRVARHPEVRAKVTALVRGLARGRSVVTEGRDQGTVVFPNADVKFFLDADLDVRARRRHKELGERVGLEDVRGGIQERDESDRQRAVGPLTSAPDAIHVDTSRLSIDQMVETLEKFVKERRSAE